MTPEQIPLSDQDERNLKLVMLLMLNATLVKNLALATAQDDRPAVAWNLAQFAASLMQQYREPEQFLDHIKAMANDLGFSMNEYQCGSEKVH
jgi:hypothetical protein